MAVPCDIRISALSLESMLNIAMQDCLRASDHGNLFDIRLPDLLDQIPSFFFSKISEDILVNIFSRLEDDPRHLARLACVCVRFSRVIKHTVWRKQCLRVVPAIVSDLMQGSYRMDHHAPEPPGGWGALQKLLVCCPGLRHAGVMLECWDFGLDRELGSSEEFRTGKRKFGELDEEPFQGKKKSTGKKVTFGVEQDISEAAAEIAKERASRQANAQLASGSTSTNMTNVQQEGEHELLHGDRPLSHGVDVVSRKGTAAQPPSGLQAGTGAANGSHPDEKPDDLPHGVLGCEDDTGADVAPQVDPDARARSSVTSQDTRIDRVKRKKRADDRQQDGLRNGACCSHEEPHLAGGMWNLTREQGNKLLASRFRADILYICDWPGCIHPGKRRKYKLFRGVFKNFKASQIWRNLKDLKPRKAGMCCAFCSSPRTWDMVSTFCLRRSHEYHDDGEPVVRAFVCENGHVAGAWTDRPLYNL